MKVIRLSLLAIVLLTACSHAQKQGEDLGQKVQNAGERTKRTVEQAASGADIIKSGAINEKADHLKSIAKSIPQVNDVYCLTIGNLAIVAVDVAPNLDRSRVDVIKYSVAEALKKDPQGANALVTADLDLTQNIREISTKVQEGHPISAFTNELGDILGRLIPQLPQDTADQKITRDPVSTKRENPSNGAAKR
ncbi:MAG: YhcN/YlaJ family sporulation lipoprotein [Gorillibacterium sp.]|nr:YhcN/YlaJ family sporulation lipoprotein [Gorillibacterium sp.]